MKLLDAEFCLKTDGIHPIDTEFDEEIITILVETLIIEFKVGVVRVGGYGHVVGSDSWWHGARWVDDNIPAVFDRYVTHFAKLVVEQP